MVSRTSVLLFASLVLSLPIRADDDASPEYPKDWGTNLTREKGVKVVEVSSSAVASGDALIDGLTGEGHYWQPEWQKGLPAHFLISLGRPVRLGRLQFTHRGDAAAPPRSVELWVGPTKDSQKLAAKLELPPKRTQVAEFEPVDGSFVKVVVTSSHQDGQLEIGEVALFPPSSGALARAPDSRDVLEPKQGDCLKGDVETAEFVIKGTLGQTTIAREQLLVLSIDDAKDGLDRAFLKTGEVFVGLLQATPVALKLSAETSVSVARENLRRITFRRVDELQDEQTATQKLLSRGHVVLLADLGKTVGSLQLESVTVRTVLGDLRFALSAVQSLDLAHGPELLDRVLLKQGDVVRGFLLASEWPFRLDGAKEALKLTRQQVNRLVLCAEADPLLPCCVDGQRITFKTEDVLSGRLPGRLQVQTAYGTFALDFTQIDRLEAQDGGRFTVRLRDGSSVQGRLAEPLLFDLDDKGGQIRLPLDRIERIDNYALPADLKKRVEALAARLNSPDGADRELAQAELEKIGRPALGALGRVLREGAPEARARAQSAAAKILGDADRATTKVTTEGRP